jgi:hypothetical protein
VAGRTGQGQGEPTVVARLTDARGLLGMNGVAADVGNVRLIIAIQSPEDEQAIRRVYQAWQERCPV